jgi:uncharacterized membrane protein YeaQ/YmgE (transglycosylase-associated protein family)
MTYLALLLVIGGLAGWLAARLVRGGGLGLWGNIGLGVTGALLGATLLGQLGVRLVGPFGIWLMALLGAVLLLWTARLFGRR